jgi:hypothetical protein
VPGNNRVADDADKRTALRSAGYMVWSFGHEDLKRFKSGDAVDPPWFDQKAASIVTGQFQVRPGLIRLLSKDPVTQLLEFMTEPDAAEWEKFGKWMPYLFVRPDNRAHADMQSVAAEALVALDGSAPFSAAGPDVCWSFTDGGISLTAGVQSTSEAPRAVLAVDDRDNGLASLEGKAWKEWLRLSNWLGLSDRHRVTTYSLLSKIPEASAAGADEVSLPPEWRAIFDEAVSDAERELISALAKAGAAVPAMGFETEDGDVIDMAWAGAKVGVSFDGGVTADGWTLCPADVTQILAVLKSNGVM